MNKERINRLLKQYQAGTLSQEEREEVEQWLDSLKKTDEQTIFLADADVDQMLVNIRQTIQEREASKVRHLRTRAWWRIAASLLAVAIASYFVWYNFSARKNVMEVASTGDLLKVVLHDSSLVWLRGNSKLTYYEKPGDPGRFAELEGEGLFEVKKDADRPFTVQGAGMTARVLGTSFNLKTGKNSIELKVISGKVNLSSAIDTQGIDVTPNQKVTYSGNSENAIVAMTTEEVASVTASTEYNMKFNRTNMAEVMRRVQGKFNVAVKADNELLKGCSVTADLTDQSLHETMRMLAGVLEFEYEIKNGAVTLRGGGCQPGS